MKEGSSSFLSILSVYSKKSNQYKALFEFDLYISCFKCFNIEMAESGCVSMIRSAIFIWSGSLVQPRNKKQIKKMKKLIL
jgi:hypothetical protein